MLNPPSLPPALRYKIAILDPCGSLGYTSNELDRIADLSVSDDPDPNHNIDLPELTKWFETGMGTAAQVELAIFFQSRLHFDQPDPDAFRGQVGNSWCHRVGGRHSGRVANSLRSRLLTLPPLPTGAKPYTSLKAGAFVQRSTVLCFTEKDKAEFCFWRRSETRNGVPSATVVAEPDICVPRDQLDGFSGGLEFFGQEGPWHHASRSASAGGSSAGGMAGGLPASVSLIISDRLEVDTSEAGDGGWLRGEIGEDCPIKQSRATIFGRWRRGGAFAVPYSPPVGGGSGKNEVLYFLAPGTGGVGNMEASVPALPAAGGERYQTMLAQPHTLAFHTWAAVGAAWQPAFGNAPWWELAAWGAPSRTWIIATDVNGNSFELGHVRNFTGFDAAAVPPDDLNGGPAGGNPQGLALQAATAAGAPSG